MQELEDKLKDNLKWIVMNADYELMDKLFKEALEKEKEQIIQAGNACGLKAIAYHKKLFEMSKDELEQELIKDGMTHGEEYYNQNYNQNK